MKLLFLLVAGLSTWAIFQAGIGLAQSSDMPFSADPAPGTTSYKTGYFMVNASPGDSLTETLRLRNDSDAQLSLRVKSVDATTGLYGGISYGLPGDPVVGVGAWTTLPSSEVQLAPREETTIPISIMVPADTSSGDYISGLAIWMPKAESQTEPGVAVQSASIETQLRRILAVHVIVQTPSQPVPVHPLLVIHGVRPVVKPDGVYLEIDIANEGKLLTKGEGYIELPDDEFHQSISLDTFVPGTSIAYPVKWINDPEEKTYQSDVVIRYDQDQRIAEWHGSFNVGPELTNEEQAREGNKPHVLLSTVIFMAVFVLAGSFLLIWWRRKFK